MASLTQFQKKMAARRGTSSIDKLSRQYQEQIKNITGEYETSFADYTKKRAETMAPFEAATEQYKKDYSVYQTSASAYKSKLSDYQAVLADISKNPYEQVGYYLTHARDGGSSMRDVVINGVGRFREDRLPSNIIDVVENNQRKIYKKREAPAFTEKAPTAPIQPVAPEIPEFDTKTFEEKKALTEQTYQRELGERKAARLGAVSRKERRPLLSSTQA